MADDREDQYRKPHIPGYIGGSPGSLKPDRSNRPRRREDDVDEERRRAE